MVSKKTKLVNIYGSAGSGKSTTALRITHYLKLKGYKVEYVPEYAKDLVNECSEHKLKYQLYVFAKQLKRLSVLMDKGLDYVITDSPLLLSYFYGKKYNTVKSYFKDMVLDHMQEYPNTINLFLERGSLEYDSILRLQDCSESDNDSKELYKLLKELNVPILTTANAKAFDDNSTLDSIFMTNDNLKNSVTLSIVNVLESFYNLSEHRVAMLREAIHLDYSTINLGRQAGHTTALNLFAAKYPNLRIHLITAEHSNLKDHLKPNIKMHSFKNYNKSLRGISCDLLVVDHGLLKLDQELDQFLKSSNLFVNTILIGS